MKYLRRSTNGAAGNVFGTTIKYLLGAADIGLGTTIKYLRRTASGAAGYGLGTRIKYLHGAAGSGLGTTIKYLKNQNARAGNNWAKTHTGERFSVRLCVNPELARCVHLLTTMFFRVTLGASLFRVPQRGGYCLLSDPS